MWQTQVVCLSFAVAQGFISGPWSKDWHLFPQFRTTFAINGALTVVIYMPN